MRNSYDRQRALDEFPALRPIASELDVYADLLRRWQSRINLVSHSTIQEVWWRHFADSIQVFEQVSHATRWADLGSGAGFPGVVVALALKARSASSVTLVESDLRKAAFLREVSRETSAPVTVDTRRAEDVIAAESAPEVVTSRALASIESLSRLTAPWIASGARGVFLVGQATNSVNVPADWATSSLRSRTGHGFVVQVWRRDSGQA